MVHLGDIANITIGKTPSRDEPRFWGQGHPWLAIRDLGHRTVIDTTKEQVTDAALPRAAGRLVPANTVVMSFKLSIGKTALTARPMYTNEAIAAFEDLGGSSARFNPRYLMRYLRTLDLSEGANRAAMGGTLNRKTLAEIPVRLPPLDEQRRIAAVLDHVDALRAKRREAIAMAVYFNNSAFSISYEGIGEEPVELAEIAEIGSGITKGRKLPPGPLADTPYLAVSNVQDGWLDLTAVKTISISEVERRRFELRAGDIVLTEGGDPDKLGRGTVWQGQISPMIHQNHIFRVRSRDTEGILPNFLARALRNREARSHFLKSAKQTTGIATINKTQLGRTPIRIPSPDVQGQVVAVAMAAEEARAVAERHLAELDNLFASLQSRAFAGELDVSKVVLPSA